MNKHVRTAMFQCYRVFGDTNISRADYNDDGFWYHNSDTFWAVHPEDDGGVGVVDIRPNAIPLEKRYAALLEQEKLNPPAPKTQRPPHIQRLRSRSKDNQVRFSERYEFDYMGNSYFEQGDAAKRLRELNDLCGMGETVINGFKIKFVYNPVNYNEAGVVATLTTLFNGKQDWWIEEETYFNPKSSKLVLEIKRDKKAWRDRTGLASVHGLFDAWLDIRYGLFWTIEDINLNDIYLNLEKQVKFLDERRAGRVGS